MKKRKEELLQVQQQIVAVDALRKAESKKLVASHKVGVASGKNRTSTITAASLKRMEAADTIMGKFNAALKGTTLQMKVVGKTSGGMWAKIRVGAMAARGAVTLFGTALLNAIPIIGQILFIGSLLIPVFNKLFGKSALEKEVGKITESFESFVAIGRQLKETLDSDSTATEKFIATLKVQVGIIAQIVDGYKKYMKTRRELGNAELVAAIAEVNLNRDRLKTAEEGNNSWGRNTQAITLYTGKLKAAKTALNSIRETQDAFKPSESQAFIEDVINSIKADKTATEAMKEQLIKLDAVLQRVKAGGKTQFKTDAEFLAAIKEIDAADILASTLSSINAAKTAMGEFQGSVNKLAGKASSPFDPVIDNLKLLSNEFTQSGKAGGRGFKAFKESAKGLQEHIDNLRGDDSSVPLLLRKSDAQVLEFAVTKLAKMRDITITTAAVVKKQQAELKKLNEISKNNPIIMERALNLQEELLKSKIADKQAQINIHKELGITAEELEKINVLEADIVAIRAESIGPLQRLATIAVSRTNEQKRINDLKNKEIASSKAILAVELALAKNALTRKKAIEGKDVTANDEFKLFNNTKEQRLAMIDLEEKAKLITIGLQWDLLDAQLALERAKAERTKGITEDELAIFDRIKELNSKVREGALEAVSKQSTLARDNVETEGVVKSRAALDASTSGTGTQGERISALTEAGGAFDPDQTLSNVGDKVAGAVNAMQPMMDLMGPEGALISAVTEGAVIMAGTWSTAFDIIGEKGLQSGEGIAAGLEAASATVGAIGSILAASSKQKIANIDQEIAAEQKRDGKSAASVAKIAALEKKKEQAKKKAFETDKKAKMAQIVMSTAAAVIQSFANAGGYPLGMPMALAMGIAGAASLAAVAGTSYQGGGSSAGASIPSAISVGSRSASVDLAKGNNPGGELAFARGESGIGSGMTDFKPTSAFSGFKNRAAGGFIVGEQGPELFMPDVPGEIIPSGQGSGGLTNVNFSISAVDATGVEELLLNQRGNIIGMLREAANEHGELFLETVQEKTL